MFVAQCHSTNSLMLEQGLEGLLWTDYQTAGRGQTGNGWESEKGKNILLSIGIQRPPIKPEQQWRMSMLFALTVLEVILANGEGRRANGQEKFSIKWPNDIYYGDSKLAGILIEHQLDSQGIAYSVLGVGININQTQWVGNAPNPTSLQLITGHEWNRERIVEQLWQHWQVNLPLLQDEPTLKQRYMAHLYRREGLFPYVEREVNITPSMNAPTSTQGQFVASIEDITPTGELVLRDAQNKIRIYHFKQIRFIL